ncbi:MAG: glucose-6-phosphate isomerase [Oscillospiraceae bacterium]|nr:glucose-6-phosphate isomerase [Oscillospiraceae bacterium]
MIKLELAGIAPFLSQSEWQKTAALELATETLFKEQVASGMYTTWLNLPETYNRDEFKRIKSAADRIRSESDVLLVIGVGGSYLGARAAIELLRSPNYNLLHKPTPNVYFVGNNLSGEHLNEIASLLRDRNFSINVISKSGETLEPAIAFRVFKTLLETRYGDVGARGRIYVTTDRVKGALRQWAERDGFQTFEIPTAVGGRYSILTAAGLLPMAVAGIDIDRVMAGAFDTMKTYMAEPNFRNPAWQYAAVRQALYQKGKTTEVLACYEPAFRYMAEWWKQLYGESCGKGQGGIFPASVEFTADLHSMGQYLQDGMRNLTETVISFERFRRDLTLPELPEDLDGLNYLAGQNLESINHNARRATTEAHIEGGVPVLEISLPDMGETTFGQLVYFFQYACALSGYLQGINPFDQPGVEAYKKNMFRRLGRPGS